MKSTNLFPTTTVIMTEYQPLLCEESECKIEELEYKIDESSFGSNDLTSIMLLSKYDDIIRKLDEMHRYMSVLFKSGKFRSNYAIKNIATDVKNSIIVVNDLKKNAIILDKNIIKLIDDKLGLVSDMLQLLDNRYESIVKRYETICLLIAIIVLITFVCSLCMILIVYMYTTISSECIVDNGSI